MTTPPPLPTPDLDSFKRWTPAAQERALDALRTASTRTWRPFWCPRPDCDGLPHDQWTWNHARADQRPPPDADWLVWLLLSGRGSGKTRTGAEYLHRAVTKVPRVSIIGGTAPDVRGVMIEGESGVLTIAKPDFRPVYEPSKRRITWPNGAVGMIFSAEEPDRLRGPETYCCWWDEPAHAPLVQDCWDNLMFGLRLGAHPRVVCTTTPRPRPWLKEIVAEPTTRVARASTYDNLANLAPPFAERVINRYEGTRLGRQELHGEILEDVEGALWNWEMIDADRLPRPALDPGQLIEQLNIVRVMVAVDPAGSSRTQADETAIVVCGRAADGHLFVLDDRSGHYSPMGWASATNNAAEDWSADAVVAETNFGGEMVASQLRMAGFHWRLITIHAKRAKAVRAEPVVGLYEQHLVHHVGVFEELETQLTGWVPYDGADSPDRLDALVYAVTALATRPGTASVASPTRAHIVEGALGRVVIPADPRSIAIPRS
jgi:phage terminase large subunit-like protein